MKQGEAARANLDLDDLERQLSAAAGPRRSGSDDPLAELARIVGHNDASRTSGKAAGSFDDFLVNPPRSVSEMMGAAPTRAPSMPAPPVAPLLKSVDSRSDARVEPLFPHSAPPPAPQSPVQSLEEQLAIALGETTPLRPTLPIEEPAAVAPQAPAAPQYVAEPAAAEPMAQTEPSPAPHGDPRFEEMLKEFDAAMRDVGARPLEPAPATAPGPESWGTPSVSPTLAYDPDSEAAAPAAPAPQGRSRLGMALAGGVIGVALIGAAGLLAFGGGSKNAVNGAAPVIAAKPGVTKERPANPGGVEVPNQDKEILARTPTTPQTVRVAPREEQPVDLTQAQRSADAQANAGGIRQIPGVIPLGPTTTQPPSAGSGTPSAPVAPPAQPRPVASVPITIAGQPPVEAPTPPAVTPPVVSRPVAAAPTPTPAPAAPAVTAAPAAPAAPTAPAAANPQPAQASANTQNASTEPRRVRAVPIRPEESAPNRAQAQPRVVPNPPARPAAPAQAEAEDDNAPLRITPQGVRGQTSRTAAVTPATVPTSTSVPLTTQSATPDPAPSAGGGSFAVQIAAEGSQEAAQAKFNRMRSQHSGVLGGVSPSIRSAEVNGRSVYRVRVGQMSREEAVSLCERLKADGGSCFVARN